MDWLREFFQTNMQVVIFSHGLVFFLIGFAVSLKSRRPSTLTLAHNLQPLAVFGILQGFAEWGVVFIPWQQTYLSAEAVQTLLAVQVVVSSLSFASLMAFGANLLADTYDRRWTEWLRWLPRVLFAVWGISFLFLPLFENAEPLARLLRMLGNAQTLTQWLNLADVWTRYLLVLPGSWLAAYALVAQFQEFSTEGMDHLIPRLRWAVFGMGVYGIFGGLIVPWANFFPANAFNTAWFLKTAGFPVEILRAAAGAIAAIALIQVLEVFDIEHSRQLEESDRVRAVLKERDRIARELHDGVIQSLYGVGLQLESARYLVTEDPKLAQVEIKGLLGRLNGAIGEIRHYILDLYDKDQERLTFRDRIGAVLREHEERTGVRIDFRIEGTGHDKLAPFATKELAQLVKEAVHNAIEHGSAKRIWVHVKTVDNELDLSVRDNGRGFNVNAQRAGASSSGVPVPGRGRGHGLRNMRQRASLLGGAFHIESEPGAGTEVQVHIPLKG